MPAHKYNENINHPNIVRYTGDNLEEVERHLKAVICRNDKEHWNVHLENNE